LYIKRKKRQIEEMKRKLSKLENQYRYVTEDFASYKEYSQREMEDVLRRKKYMEEEGGYDYILNMRVKDTN
jgi:molecular chaperone GrpE (heat shock protein)